MSTFLPLVFSICQRVGVENQFVQRGIARPSFLVFRLRIGLMVKIIGAFFSFLSLGPFFWALLAIAALLFSFPQYKVALSSLLNLRKFSYFFPHLFVSSLCLFRRSCFSSFGR